jgi:hypothetical protein
LVIFVDSAKQSRTRDKRIQLLIHRMLQRVGKSRKRKIKKVRAKKVRSR